jgi:hypothetical protein
MYNRNNEITDCRLNAINLFFFYNRKRGDIGALEEVLSRVPRELIPVVTEESYPLPSCFYKVT